MVFSSPVFLFLFLPIVLIGYHGIFRKTASGNLWLLLASILFYAWGEPVFVFVILISSILNWQINEQIKKHSGKKRKLLFVTILILDVAVLVISKYTGFLLDNLNLLLHTAFTTPFTHLPIGISFFTFQIISCQVETYCGTQKDTTALRDFMLYALLFPQLVAGPIVRFDDVKAAMQSRSVSAEDSRGSRYAHRILHAPDDLPGSLPDYKFLCFCRSL